METDVYTFALRNTLKEITSACPDVQSIFLFKEDGEMIDAEGAQEETAVRAVDTLDDVLQKAETLGGVQNIIIDAAAGTVDVSRMNGFYLVTVAPKSTDLNYVNTLIRAPLQTVLRVLEKISPAIKDGYSKPEKEESTVEQRIKTPHVSTLEPSENHEERVAPESGPERVLTEPLVNQFMVENAGGLFTPSDTVRIDAETISQWTELYGDKSVREVTVETFGGKSAQCKLKPIRGSKYEGKGIIQIPEKIQQTLEVVKGELVRVKPVIE